MKWIIWGSVFVLVVIVLSGVVIAQNARGLSFTERAAVPARPVALVFGAEITHQGHPARMLAGRLDGGIALYRAGKVRTIVLTGDDGRRRDNELAAMRSYVEAHGISEDHIRLINGYTTYESCRNAASGGIRSAILVTQKFHMPRTLFLCRAMKMDAVGFALGDWGVYGRMMMLRVEAREALAGVKAITQVLMPGIAGG